MPLSVSCASDVGGESDSVSLIAWSVVDVEMDLLEKKGAEGS